MKTKTERVLAITNIIMWLIFVGLCIQTGATIVSYIVSLLNPVAAKNLYMGLNFFDLRQYDINHYNVVILFVIALGVLKAYTAYLTIKIFSEINLSQPFSIPVAELIQKISQTAFITGLVAVMAYSYSEWLTSEGHKVSYNWASGEYLLLAGVVFVIAQVFKKGTELQAESNLTI